MFKSLLALFLLLTSIATSHQISSFQEAAAELEQLDSDALVVFDVDQVLITNQDALLTAAGDALRNQLIFEEMSSMSPQQLKHASKLILLAFLSPQKRLVENTTPDLIRSLQKRGIKVIALTHCRTGSYGDLPSVEQWRIDELKSFGIDFSWAFPEAKRVVLHSLAKPEISAPLFQDGILFSLG